MEASPSQARLTQIRIEAACHHCWTAIRSGAATQESALGEMPQWIFRVNQQEFFLNPFTGTWFYHDRLHNTWEDAGIKIDEAILAVINNQFYFKKYNNSDLDAHLPSLAPPNLPLARQLHCILEVTAALLRYQEFEQALALLQDGAAKLMANSEEPLFQEKMRALLQAAEKTRREESLEAAAQLMHTALSGQFAPAAAPEASPPPGLTCSLCHAENRAGSAFCSSCGARFCARCAVSLPAGSRFCNQCGAPLDAS
jgi:hypothetical protein